MEIGILFLLQVLSNIDSFDSNPAISDSLASLHLAWGRLDCPQIDYELSTAQSAVSFKIFFWR